jgi:hypothetical protein
MSGIPYHAWTHRPKEQGGTDPIPVTPAVAAPIEWYAAVSTTNLDADDNPTKLVYSFLSGTYDTGPPTFDIVSGNIAIAKDGFYMMSHYPYNSNRSSYPGHLSELDIWSLNVAGTAPFGWHPWSGAGSIYNSLTPDLLPFNDIPAYGNSRYHPSWTDHFGFSDGTFPGTACQIATYLNHYIDQANVDDIAVIVKTTVIRFGSVWST